MADLTIGQRIAQERKRLELSQMGLAARLEVSRQAISKWESDSAIPEIDKLIALSRLFGVSVGWLLGVEDPAAPQEPALSEDQFKIVEELVKKYQTPPKPRLNIFHYLLAFGTSLLIFLLLYGTTTRLEKHILMYQANIRGLDQRLEALEAAASVQPSGTPGQLLAGYSFDLYPLTKTKSTHRVKVSFSAVPHVWNQEDTGYLYISGGEDAGEPIRTKCSWDGSRLSAQVDLDVANGYSLCFAVEHPGGSQEQQILEEKRIQWLENECAIPIRIQHGSFVYQEEALTLTDYSVSFNLPPIYTDPSTMPYVTVCEYRLYRRPQSDSRLELARVDVTNRLEPGMIGDYHHQISGEPVTFENVTLENTSHFQLNLYIELSSGVEKEIHLAVLFPDGMGGLTE